jgi:CRISPR-associated protein Cas2
MPYRAVHLACYDVSSPSRLKAALDVSRRYATGGQKSVHECWLTAAEHGDLLNVLANVIDEDEDRVLLVRLDGRRQVIPLGAARSPADNDCIVIGAAA